MHQLGLQTVQKIRGESEYNNTVEESSLVHTGNEHLNQQIQRASKLLNKRHADQLLISCIPRNSTSLDTKVQYLAFVCSYMYVSSKCSLLLGVYVESGHFKNISVHVPCESACSLYYSY